MIICSYYNISHINETGNAIDNFLRYWEISSFHSALADVAEARIAFPNVSYRYFFMASKPLATGIEELDFSPEVIEPMIQIGLDDAAIMINSTKPGDSFKRIDEWYNDNTVSESPSAYIYKPY